MHEGSSDIQVKRVPDIQQHMTEGRWTLTIEGPLYSAQGKGLLERQFRLMSVMNELVNIPRPDPRGYN